MKKLIIAILVATFFTGLGSLGLAKEKLDCTKIQDGLLTYSSGHYLEDQALATGYDIFGYNYQGHIFNGSYANAYLGKDGYPPYSGDDDNYLAENPGVENTWYWPYREIRIVMKWNDAWLSNQDCDGDGSLDRHLGFESYIGSGAWEEYHEFGVLVDDETGEESNYTYYCKIVAAPADAYIADGYWWTAEGVEIGAVIWGEFAIIQEVYSGPEGHDKYISPAGAGLGLYKAE